MKHTPGPWTAKMDQFDFTNAGERYVVFGNPEDDAYGTVALVRPRLDRKERGKNKTPYNAPDAERDANAVLIATAPELLDYLERVVEEARRSVKAGTPFDRGNLLAGADKIIKKARGA